MNSAKKLVSTATVSLVFVLVVGLVIGGTEKALAATPSKAKTFQEVMVVNSTAEPVPVRLQGTAIVAGSVEVSNWPTDPLPVAQQGLVQVSGMVGIDPTANTVQIDSTAPVAVAGRVGIDPTANTVQIDSAAPVAVAGRVGIDPTANTVQIDSTAPVAVTGKVEIDSTTPVSVAPQGTTSVAGSVSVSNSTSNPVPVAPQGTTNVAGSVTVSNPSSSPVQVAQVGTLNVAGTVGLATYGNTVKLDTANNTVKVTNPTGQALDVRVVEGGGGGGGSAPQPVQFTSFYTSAYSWTDAYTVPAGKILKIENVSVYAESTTLFPVVSMRTTVGGVTSEHWLPALEAEYMPQMATGTKIFSGANPWRMCTQVAIYADENTVVQSVGRCNCGNPCGCTSPVGFRITFSGYLTDK